MSQYSYPSMEIKNSISKEIVLSICQITQFLLLALDCLFPRLCVLIHRCT